MWKNTLRFTPLAAGGFVQFLDSISSGLQVISLVAGIALTTILFMNKLEEYRTSKIERQRAEEEWEDEQELRRQ